MKNFLVFVPLLASHTILQLLLLRASVLTFAAFCLCASAIYVRTTSATSKPTGGIQQAPATVRLRRAEPADRCRLVVTLLTGAAVLSILTLSWPVTVVLVTYVVGVERVLAAFQATSRCGTCSR